MGKRSVRVSILASAATLLLSSMVSADPVSVQDAGIAQQDATITQPLSIEQEVTLGAAEQQAGIAFDDSFALGCSEHIAIDTQSAVQEIELAANH
jgi:hypothetical protein